MVLWPAQLAHLTVQCRSHALDGLAEVEHSNTLTPFILQLFDKVFKDLIWRKFGEVVKQREYCREEFQISKLTDYPKVLTHLSGDYLHAVAP